MNVGRAEVWWELREKPPGQLLVFPCFFIGATCDFDTKVQNWLCFLASAWQAGFVNRAVIPFEAFFDRKKQKSPFGLGAFLARFV